MKQSLLLIAIIGLFLATRTYKIEQVPVSLYWDEASIGYNAYSILTTGKDEWGKVLPIHFRAFGEFKLPIFIYSVVFAELLLGLREAAIRLPAVFFSLLGVLLTYLLSLKLTGNKKIATFSAFFLTLSPWLFIFSRTGYEATAGLAFFLLGIYFLFRSVKNYWFLPLSTLAFVASLYSYNSFRIVVPLALLPLAGFLVNKFNFKSKNLSLVLAGCILVFILSFIPIVRLFLFDQGASRLQTIGVLGSGNFSQVLTKVISNYFSHFSPEFLFLKGDSNLRSQIPGFGEAYLLDIPFLIAGALSIISGVKNKHFILLLPIFMIVIAPLPAAITRESPHALRAIVAVPFLAIVSAIGVIWFEKRIKWQQVFEVSLIVIYLLLFINYFLAFINVYPLESASAWQSEYKSLFTSNISFKNHPKTIISDNYGQPYIFALYYLKYDPNKFRAGVVYNPVNQWGHSTVSQFDNLSFKKITLEDLAMKENLIFATPEELLNSSLKKKIVYDVDGKVAFEQYGN